MNRIVVLTVAVLVIIGLAVSGGVYVNNKRQADALEAERARLAAAQAQAAAKYRRLSDVQSRVNAALDHLSELQRAYDEKFREAATASHKRHDLVDSQPYNVAGGLAFIAQEKSGVEALQSVTAEKAEAARSAASVFAEVYGDGATSTIVSDVSVAAESEGAGLSDWWHATRAIYDSFSARAKGRYYIVNDDVGGLYKSSDDEAARSRQRWATVGNRFATLRSRLDREVSDANLKSGGEGGAQLGLSTPAPPQFTSGSGDRNAGNSQADTVSPGQIGGQTQAIVKQFYADINAHRLNDAYALLSNNFRSDTSPSAFRNGYKTTVSVTASTSVADDPSIVSVDLVAKDRKPGSGAVVTTRYSGTWHVVWNDAKHTWLLDDGRFGRAANE